MNDFIDDLIGWLALSIVGAILKWFFSGIAHLLGGVIKINPHVRDSFLCLSNGCARYEWLILLAILLICLLLPAIVQMSNNHP